MLAANAKDKVIYPLLGFGYSQQFRWCFCFKPIYANPRWEEVENFHFFQPSDNYGRPVLKNLCLQHTYNLLIGH